MAIAVTDMSAGSAGALMLVIGLGSISPGALMRGMWDMALDWDRRRRPAVVITALLTVAACALVALCWR